MEGGSILQKLLQRLNGNAIYVRLVFELVVVGMLLWTFFQVRDLPANYCSRSEAKEIKQDLQDSIGRVMTKLDSIETYLREGHGK